jgi:hypothetical protein
MTMREELIKAGAKAVWLSSATFAGKEEYWLTMADFDREPYVRNATAALDAILAGLDEPSEEMLGAGANAFLAAYGREGSVITTHEALASAVPAMLKPLKGE